MAWYGRAWLGGARRGKARIYFNKEAEKWLKKV